MDPTIRDYLFVYFQAHMFDSRGRICSPRLRLKNHQSDPIVHQYLKDNLDQGISISESVYRIINHIQEIPLCQFCSYPAVYGHYGTGFNKTCGNMKCVRIGYGQNPHIPTESERKMHSQRMKENNPMFDKEVVHRVKITQQAKFHGHLPMHDPEAKVRSLNSRYDQHGTFSPMSRLFKPKHYRLPSGKNVWIQGYENQALDILLTQFPEEDIVLCGRSHRFRYVYEGMNRNYYPDIFLPKQNRYIEVKSDYTYSKALDKNLAKRSAVVIAGFEFSFWIINHLGQLSIV